MRLAEKLRAMAASRTAVRIRRLDLAFLAVAGLILLAGLIWLLGPGAGWVLEHVDDVTGLSGKERAEALDAIRGRGLALSTGVVALVAVFYTARNADTARRTYEVGQRTLALGEQGLVTDRYTKAIEQLGSSELAVRLGGVYALERIARDSVRDHPTVLEVLTAFVREPSRLAPASQSGHGTHGQAANAPASLEGRPRLRADVQAAVAVIGRRNVNHDDPDRGRVDLAEAHLAGADLAGAQLGGVDLAQADLTDADLTGADLSRANLWRANLTRARLTRTDLSGAILDGAQTH
ncbi:pentapeptide repeat-containing protein [Nonomuraea fuscirosea]|uniref:pentapeptide repeat-containing protein n=1 Tax=Nonomuraea fuscirosea TaxID=1291556 RepID=UPI002DDB2576|nr:pentapeptide repeat-containing protein [Nonomuraea fuscirosea]WSA56050.1 pentapeptide repeat-containing protein [Nonomuraea fuscirosea]